MKRANQGLGIGAILLGAAIFLYGRHTGLQTFSGKTPGPGFLPYLVAIGIALCGVAILLGSQKLPLQEDSKEKLVAGLFLPQELHNFGVVIGVSILVMLGANLLGLLLCMGIGVVLMAKLLGTPSWKTCILVGVASTFTFWLIFDWFLKVPLPRGILGI